LIRKNNLAELLRAVEPQYRGASPEKTDLRHSDEKTPGGFLCALPFFWAGCNGSARQTAAASR